MECQGVASLGMMSKAETARKEGDSISLHVNEIQLYVQEIYNGLIDEESFETISDAMQTYVHDFYKE